MLRTLVLVLLLIPAWPLSPQAADATLRMGGSAWYPPFHYPLESEPEDGSPAAGGFDVALSGRIAAGLGRTIEYRFDNWNSVLQALEDGRLDLVPMFVSAQRQQRFLFSDPYNVEYHQLFGLASQPAQQGLQGLAGFSVAMEEAAYAAEQLAIASPTASVLMASSEAEALRMVSRGAADYALIPAQVAYYTLETEGLANVVSLSPPLLPVPYAFAINRNAPELVAEVNTQLQLLQRDGSLRRLREAWLYAADQPVPPGPAAFNWWWPAALALLAGLFAFAWLGHIRQLQQRFAEQNLALEVAQEQLRALRLTDHLTGLMTRQYFLHQLEELLKGRTAEQGALAVGMILIRDTGTIEQSLGPTVVDQLIARLARQLEQLRIGEIGYFGSSRFIVLLDGPAYGLTAVEAMHKLLAVIGRDHVIDGTAIKLHPLAGMSSWPRDGGDASELIRNAMVALNQAWSDNLDLMEFDASLDPDPGSYKLAGELRQAISSGDLTWVLQPQYDIRSSSIIGAEMLVRWEHPEQGMVPPDLFIPIAEQSDLIQQITRQAVTRAVAIQQEWQRAGRKLQLSVNVSPLDIADLAFVEELLQLAGSLAGTLTLEITEAAVAQNGSLLRKGVARLREGGIRVSLDDYGTGYASLTHLKELSFDELKLDRSFTASICSNERLLRLTRASILLGLELGCQIVAEGVEDAQTAALLRDQGCYLLQGYLISRPLSLATFNQFLDMPLAFDGHPFNRWSEPATISSGRA